MMTLEEARQRVQICNGHIEPKRVDDRWVCDNCGIGLAEEKRNASGFCHYFDPGPEKQCTICKETKHITEFYYRKGALDNHHGDCKVCSRKSTAHRESQMKIKGRTRHIWLPLDLWNAVQKVKGHQTFRDFVVVAVRKEVEVRARDLMLRHAVDNINSKKPTRV